MAIFKNPNDPDNIFIITKVKEWVKAKLNLDEASLIQVIEVDCADPGCMDKATRILITSIDNTMRQFSIHKPLVYVRKPDIDQVFIGL